MSASQPGTPEAENGLTAPVFIRHRTGPLFYAVYIMWYSLLPASGGKQRIPVPAVSGHAGGKIHNQWKGMIFPPDT